MSQIKLKRGPSSNITSLVLAAGEPAVAEDKDKLYIGRSDGTKFLVNPDLGAAESANKLTTPRNFSATGDVTAPVQAFNGEQNVVLTMTLANSGITPGTYKSATFDAKGRATAGSNPTTLSGFGITDTYTAVQIDGKILVVEGKISDVEAIAKGASRAVVFDTLAALNAWLAIPANVAQLRVGDNFLIRELSVPDFWWDGTQKLELETQKVDLSNIYTKAEITTLLAGKEPAIPSGTAAQYWSGLKSFVDFATSVRAAALTGLSTATNAAISATDTVLVALGKLQAQTNARLPLAGGTMTGKVTMPASTTTAASINIPHGSAPTTPGNGDIWTDSTTLNARINGTNRAMYHAGNAATAALTTATQAEAEAGTGTTVRGWTPQRVQQATAAAIASAVIDGGTF